MAEVAKAIGCPLQICLQHNSSFSCELRLRSFRKQTKHRRKKHYSSFQPDSSLFDCSYSDTPPKINPELERNSVPSTVKPSFRLFNKVYEYQTDKKDTNRSRNPREALYSFCSNFANHVCGSVIYHDGVCLFYIHQRTIEYLSFFEAITNPSGKICGWQNHRPRCGTSGNGEITEQDKDIFRSLDYFRECRFTTIIIQHLPIN